MNPGSEFEPPTTPHRMPGRPFDQPTQPPTLPPGPPPGRPSWVLPLVAVVVVLIVAAGAGLYLLYGKAAGRGEAAKPPATTGKAPAGGTAFDACALVPKAESERLVPDATMTGDSRDSADAYVVDFSCSWANNRISFGEYWRNREITLKVEQHKGEGAKTSRSMAQNSYQIDYTSAKYRETTKPTPAKGDKEYISDVTDLQGVGDAAFAQYTWRRSGAMLWYSFGEAQGRVGDMTFEVKYQASQQRKDAKVLTNEGTQSITEANAIREVGALAKAVAQGIATWKAANPDVMASTMPKVSASPSATAKPEPTTLAAFPPVCTAIQDEAMRLAPGATPRARGLEDRNDHQTECRWLNMEVPGEAGGTRVRSAMVTLHAFANRAGGADLVAAKGLFAQRHAGTVMRSVGGITWGDIKDLKGMGDAAFSQYIAYRQGDVFNGGGTVIVRVGATVAEVSLAGADVPKGKRPNDKKVRLLTEREAVGGATALAKALLAELARQPVGS
ncbi:hypothetical protein OIE66_27480 [Nonomuraea sp. NBC_01738]|uniref:hypothetical protein n=1 Tax=Nonomuraea sp. NBC_01738 TaxID=2976003 RepID=UPI002E0EEF51|nr:hypothetical protein OIE66_27480 [Nonomuraea sp. NBC_01738]